MGDDIIHKAELLVKGFHVIGSSGLAQGWWVVIHAREGK